MSNSNRDINAELLQAAKKGDINEVRRLISERADVNAYDGSQGNSLYWAVKNDHSDIAKVLLDNGATFIAYDSFREHHVLSKYEKVEAEHCKVSLHLAARLGNLEAVKDLLGKGADINAQNDKGETPFDLATDDKIKTLLQPTEKSDPVDESSTDSKGGQEGDAQTEEQQSSFFGSLFSILMKPFSLIASFFGGFFHGCLGLTKKKLMNLHHKPMLVFLYLNSIH